jgi:hypothetical protein
MNRQVEKAELRKKGLNTSSGCGKSTGMAVNAQHEKTARSSPCGSQTGRFSP